MAKKVKLMFRDEKNNYIQSKYRNGNDRFWVLLVGRKISTCARKVPYSL